jgi:hypothetical protein
LQDQVELRLQCANVRYFDARVYQKPSPKIQTLNAGQAPTLFVPTCPKEKYGAKAQAPLPVDISPTLSQAK